MRLVFPRAAFKVNSLLSAGTLSNARVLPAIEYEA